MAPHSILVVDDNADARTMTQRVLERAGYRVRTAASGTQALALQRESPVDVLITDIFMPEGDGFETMKSFRAEFPQTKIVVVSGDSRRARKDYLHDASLIGADATMPKPLDPRELLALLRTLLG